MDLLLQGADLQARNENGDTLLIAAADRGFSNLVTALLQRGARLEDKDQFGADVREVAIARGHTKTIQVIGDFILKQKEIKEWLQSGVPLKKQVRLLKRIQS